MGRSAMSDRPDWITYFDTIAQAVALRGDCERHQVGAVITTPDHYIVATGYNGFPRGLPGCKDGGCTRGQWARLLEADQPADSTTPSFVDAISCKAHHAEYNAIATAMWLGRTSSLNGSTMYVTRLPCRTCYILARKFGITTIYAEGRRINS